MKTIDIPSTHRLSNRFSLSSLAWASIITALVLAAAASADAETASSTPIAAATVASSTDSSILATSPIAGKYQAFNAEIQMRQMTLASKRLALASSTEAAPALSPLARTRVSEAAELIAGSLQTNINELQATNAKLHSVAAVLTQRGADLSAITPLLDDADSLIFLANEALRDNQVNTRYATESATPQTEWIDVRGQFTLVSTILTEAHNVLEQAVSAGQQLTGATGTIIGE